MKTHLIKNNHFDSNIYISIRWASFIIASAVSALLNLFLFTSLDPSYIWLLASISICLEGTKVSTIMTRNCFASIYEKVRKPSIKAKQHIFMTFYLLLAVLSITAGLGFSLTITARTEATNTTYLEVLRQNREAINRQNEIVLSIEEEYRMIRQSDLSDNEEYKTWNQKFIDEQSNYTQADLAYRTALGLPRNTDEEIAKYNAEELRTRQLRQAAATARDIADRERKAVETRFNRMKNTDSIDILKAEENQKLQLLIQQANLDESIKSGAVALIELDHQIKQEENKHLLSKGMGFMFEQFATYLHTTPNLVKLWILLFVAILIEITIYQTSPDIRISRRVLYFFRNSLPHDVDANEILNKFDEENKKFEDIKEEKKEIIIPEADQLVEVLNIPLPEEKKEEPIIKPKRKYTKRQKVPDMQKAVESVKTDLDRLFPPIEEQEIKEETPIIETLPTIKANEIKEEMISGIIEKSSEESSIHYRFGKANTRIKNRFIEFVNACIGGIGPFIKSPETGSGEIKLPSRATAVFLDRLSNLRINDIALIYKNKDGNYMANFDAQTILNYSLEIIEDE